MATARQGILPFLSTMTHHCTNRELTIEMAARYDLDEDDVSFITGSGANTKKVERIIEEATKRREERATAAAPMGPGDPDREVETVAEPTETSPDEDEDESNDGQAGLSDFV